MSKHKSVTKRGCVNVHLCKKMIVNLILCIGAYFNTATTNTKTMQFTSSTTSSDSMIRLISSEGDEFELQFNAIKGSNLISTMFGIEADEDEYEDEDIKTFPIMNVSTAVLSKVVEFANHTLEEKLPEIPKPISSLIMSEMVPQWYADFVDNVDQEELYGILLAANFMDIPELLSLTCAKAASTIRGKTCKELCEQFGVKYNKELEDETDDEELKKQYPWIENIPNTMQTNIL
jgi:S-phase kinase-associated protein 1